MNFVYEEDIPVSEVRCNSRALYRLLLRVKFIFNNLHFFFLWMSVYKKWRFIIIIIVKIYRGIFGDRKELIPREILLTHVQRGAMKKPM